MLLALSVIAILEATAIWLLWISLGQESMDRFNSEQRTQELRDDLLKQKVVYEQRLHQQQVQKDKLAETNLELEETRHRLKEASQALSDIQTTIDFFESNIPLTDEEPETE